MLNDFQRGTVEFYLKNIFIDWIDGSTVEGQSC